MEDTPLAIIGIIVSAILMFIVPLYTIADRNDDIAQLTVSTITAEFVENIIKTGKITNTDYQNYILGLESTGNTYDIDIELKILDENPSQRTTNKTTEIGDNAYYSLFTSQIEDKLAKDYNEHKKEDPSYNAKIVLKEGDVISVTAKNSSKTVSQILKNIYYTMTTENVYIISSSSTGTIAVNGAT